MDLVECILPHLRRRISLGLAGSRRRRDYRCELERCRRDIHRSCSFIVIGVTACWPASIAVVPKPLASKLEAPPRFGAFKVGCFGDCRTPGSHEFVMHMLAEPLLSDEALMSAAWRRVVPERVYYTDPIRGSESWVAASDYTAATANPLAGANAELIRRLAARQPDLLRVGAAFADVSVAIGARTRTPARAVT